MFEQDPFADIIGHEAALMWLRQALSYQSLSHALLLSGPSGVGKYAVAERVARTLLGVKDLATHPDVSIVRRAPGERDISIDAIRELRTRLQLGSFLNSWKIAVIDGAETLSSAASNALLKTLEEPASRVLVVLVATSGSVLPATIRSRCQEVRFRLVPETVIAHGLELCGQSRHDALVYAAAAAGRPGTALRLAADEEARTARALVVSQCAALVSGRTYERMRAAEAVAGSGPASRELANDLHARFIVWIDILRQALAVSFGLRDSVAESSALTVWARRTAPGRIAAGISRAASLQQLLHTNTNPRLCLEQFVLSFA